PRPATAVRPCALPLYVRVLEGQAGGGHPGPPGECRPKMVILSEYGSRAAAGLTLESPLIEGESGTYQSTLTPPPGQGPRHDRPAPGAAPPKCHPRDLPHHPPQEQRTRYA